MTEEEKQYREFRAQDLRSHIACYQRWRDEWMRRTSDPQWRERVAHCETSIVDCVAELLEIG